MDVGTTSAEMQGNHLGHLLALARLHVPQAPLAILSHGESVAAWEKQTLLPPGVFVQKSLTLLLGQQIVLVSGLDDFHLERWQMRTIARLLSVPAAEARNQIINPSWLSAELTSGLCEGMVSPFFPPNFAASLSFAAVILLPLPNRLSQNDQVAISLSLHSSLLFPARQLHPFVLAYGLRHYPQVPVLTLPRPDLTLVEPAHAPVKARHHARTAAVR